MLEINLNLCANLSNILLKCIECLAGHEIDLSRIAVSDIPSPAERVKVLANDAVAVVKYFNLVVHSFISFLLALLYSTYYVCIEEQGQQTLHIHLLVWLICFKAVSDLESELKDEAFAKNLIHYLESTIKKVHFAEVSEISSQDLTHPSDEMFSEKLQ